MAHRAKVVASVESPCGLRCCDVTAEPGGGFAWASFRRDPEDGHGWRPEGPGAAGFATAEAAMRAARAATGWMEAEA
jgi:hypothetical protein